MSKIKAVVIVTTVQNLSVERKKEEISNWSKQKENLGKAIRLGDLYNFKVLFLYKIYFLHNVFGNYCIFEFLYTEKLVC